MRRTLWLVVVAACSGGGREPDATPSATPGPPAVKLPPPPVTATHGSAIVAVAVTQDGAAVVSADQQGGIRLWPELDGTREPIVVAGPAPHGLGIARDGDGFVIADQDSADGVELIRVGPSGAVRGRATLATEPRIEQIELTPAGALVQRADQTIELVDPAGVRRSQLVSAPGSHVFSVLVRNGRALVMTVDDKRVRGRWIELDHDGARWGATTPALPVDPKGAIALSPDFETIVGIRAKDHQPIIVTLATGKPTKTPVCTTGPVPPRRDEDDVALDEGSSFGGIRADLLPQPVGFYDGKTIACSVSSQLAWWSTSGAAITPARADVVTTAGMAFAIADHRLIGGMGHQLGMFSPDGPHYLGYGFRELTHVRVAPTGVMIGKGDQQPLLLDGRLHERARFQLPKQTVDWTDLLPIDDRYVLTIATRPQSADAWGNSYQVSVYDAVKHTVHQLLPYRAHDSELAYEPTSRLLVSSDAGATLLLRLDPSTHSFGDRIEIQTKQMIKRVYLLDPALANGLVALAVHDDDGGLIVMEIHGDDLGGTTVAPRRTYAISGDLRAVDRAGRVYVHQLRDKDAVNVFTNGAPSARLADAAAMALRPSLDGTRVAAFGNARIDLFGSDGKQLWEAAAWGASDVGWTPSGELFARFPGALAKIDPVLGTLTDRQCGWAFGLSETPFETTANAPIVCDVAP